ncbi:MAG: sulfurtransferase [Desulfuromonadales bacterium]
MKRLALFSWVLPLLFLTALPAQAALGDFFVDTAWLAVHRKDVKVVDVRVTPLYLLGHIDEALSLQKEEFLSTRGGVKSLVTTAAEFEALMDRYGITPETTVVAYAEHDNPYAARFVWTLRYHGHDKAYVLDGGYEKWSEEKRPTAFLPTKIVATSGYRCQKGVDIRAEVDYLLTRLGNPGVTVWDTRKASEYNGTEVRADRGGHIPGAVHLDWVNLQKEVNGVRVLKSEKEIRALLAAAGITPYREIVAHCQTGIRSSYATLVLLGLGYPVRNYDGSWIEWANNSALPVETTIRTAARSKE